MNEDNQIKTNSRIFEYLGIVSFVATGFICAWSIGLFKLLFKADYLEGYIVAPYLFLAPLLQMLFQVAANQFLVIKKTWPNLFILSAGAILNIIINYFLIPALGIEGASIATLMGYVVSNVLCVLVLVRMKLMVVSRRFILASFIMVGFMLAWRLLFADLLIIGTIAAVVLMALMIVIYSDELRTILNILKHKE